MPLHKTIDPNGFLTITISRPEALNALNGQVIADLVDSFSQVRESTKIKAVILTGEGEKAFVAGADIAELAAMDRKTAYELSRKGQKLFGEIEALNKPVIAAINGFALGGGCELAMACHIRLATTNAKLGQPEINLGIIPGYGGTQRLTQLVGRGKALELLLTADMISADEARAIGLVNNVYPTRDEMMKAAVAMVTKIVSKSPLAIERIIQSVNAGFEFEKTGYETEAQAFAASAETADFKEGTSAFLEKRKPVFRGV